MNPARRSGCLMLARASAWTLHISGWLVLGALGRQHWPLWAGGLLPLALWLGGLAALLEAGAGRRISRVTVASLWALAAGACLAAAALVDRGQAALAVLVLAGAWTSASAAVNWAVRLLRQPQPAPVWQAGVPAVLGLALGGGLGLPILLGDAGLTTGGCWAAAAVAVLGPALCAGRLPARSGCPRRPGDGWPTLQGPDLGCWGPDGLPASGPASLAAWSMLPMMAGLPLLLLNCSGDRLSPAVVAWAHLAAMALPGAAVRAWRLPPAWTCGGLLLAGGLALMTLPLVQGLMLATLLHTAAWSTAWVAALAPDPRPPRRRVAQVAPILAAAGPLGAVLVLGVGLAGLGLQALWLAHLLLALLAGLWCAGRLVHRAVPTG